jgi:hypothetical protein
MSLLNLTAGANLCQSFLPAGFVTTSALGLTPGASSTGSWLKAYHHHLWWSQFSFILLFSFLLTVINGGVNNGKDAGFDCLGEMISCVSRSFSFSTRIASQAARHTGLTGKQDKHE